ncbi:Multidrug resistance efflux pump [Allopseudospirillum japonicum]|uniref:Multidrug resistance efflux pump n=1 Tax=Allopseudospirillum japonicum TaxID=64971 RepID=A0A1H6RUV1_9GAMM|nr:HlyD family efflux transporter periplasmic adaptor subunit [Allopseudospirillum japonicum]SEI59499.1 Multidrug resistance efflux pump [Allopseudospirillum japonicum]
MSASLPSTQVKSKKAWPQWLVILLVLAITGALIFLLLAWRQAPSKNVQSEQSWRVASLPIWAQAYAPQMILFGVVEAREQAQLKSAVIADVQEVYQNAGESVSAGQMLLQLDPREAQWEAQQRQAEVEDLQAQIAAAKIKHQADLAAYRLEQELVTLTEQSWTRYQELRQQRSASQANVDDAQQALLKQKVSLVQRRQTLETYPSELAKLQARLQKAQAQAALAELNLERTQVRAPFAGEVTQVQVAPGDRVTPGTPLITLYNPDSLEITAQVSHQYLPQLRQALAQKQDLYAYMTLEDGQPSRWRLARLAAQIEKGQGGVSAFFQPAPFANTELTNIKEEHTQARPDADWGRPELNRPVTLTLVLPPVPQSLPIPGTALYDNQRVYVVESGRLRGYPVTPIGQWQVQGQQQAYILIDASQLPSGADLVTTQLPNAIEGLKVEVIAEQSLAAPAEAAYE